MSQDTLQEARAAIEEAIATYFSPEEKEALRFYDEPIKAFSAFLKEAYTDPDVEIERLVHYHQQKEWDAERLLVQIDARKEATEVDELLELARLYKELSFLQGRNDKIEQARKSHFKASGIYNQKIEDESLYLSDLFDLYCQTGEIYFEYERFLERTTDDSSSYTFFTAAIRCYNKFAKYGITEDPIKKAIPHKYIASLFPRFLHEDEYAYERDYLDSSEQLYAESIELYKKGILKNPVPHLYFLADLLLSTSSYYLERRPDKLQCIRHVVEGGVICLGIYEANEYFVEDDPYADGHLTTIIEWLDPEIQECYLNAS